MTLVRPERNYEIRRLSGDDESSCERFLLAREETILYQGSAFRKFLEALLDCRDVSQIAVTPEGEIRGLLPLMETAGTHGRVLNSLPFYGSNGGIIADDAEVADDLLARYDEIATAPGILSSTVITSPFSTDSRKAPVHTHRDYRIAQYTPLPTPDELDDFFGRIDSSARRNIRKARREGVVVERDADAIDWLREMHQENIRAIGGVEKDDRFFELIPRCFEVGRDYEIYVARSDGEPVAALLAFLYNRTVEYYTPAIDPEFRSQQPLPLIIIEAMADASRRGFLVWNWGGTWAAQDGVYRFKKKWATSEGEYHYYTQLNDEAVLGWSRARFLEEYPNVYVVPFSALRADNE